MIDEIRQLYRESFVANEEYNRNFQSLEIVKIHTDYGIVEIFISNPELFMTIYEILPKTA